ncbi:hypothetical protein DRQ07_04980 [candidate division KSB1 bacterium]|nr:MAG: hypothetical protein DRQ07_04980 [candidate division KSB1 bacterium]
MVFLFAMIGLIFLLWYLSKGLKKLGSFLEQLGERIEDERALRTKTNANIEKLISQIKGAQKKRNIINKDTDEQYLRRIKKEIDEITGDL